MKRLATAWVGAAFGWMWIQKSVAFPGCVASRPIEGELFDGLRRGGR